MRSGFQNALAFALLLLTLNFLPLHAAAAERTIVTSQDLDYFGFDFETKSDVSLDQCKALCLADQQCRAFTYTGKQQWCFLKSDHGVAKPQRSIVRVEPQGGQIGVTGNAHLA